MNSLKYYINERHLKYLILHYNDFNNSKSKAKRIYNSYATDEKKVNRKPEMKKIKKEDRERYNLIISNTKIIKNTQFLINNKKVNINFLKNVSRPHKILQKSNNTEYALLLDILTFCDLSIPYKKRLFSYLIKNEDFVDSYISKGYEFDWLSRIQRDKMNALKVVEKFLK